MKGKIIRFTEFKTMRDWRHYPNALKRINLRIKLDSLKLRRVIEVELARKSSEDFEEETKSEDQDHALDQRT